MSKTQSPPEGILAELKENGFCRVPGYFDAGDVDAVRSVILDLYRKFVPDDDRFDGVTDVVNSPLLDEALIDLRARDPQVFGALYDSAQSSVPFIRLVTSTPAIAIATAVLGVPSHQISWSGLLLRMDAPEDKRNILTWHQDRSYFFQNKKGENGLVLSVALQDITSEMGAVRACVGSHRGGYISDFIHTESNKLSTEQRRIPDDIVAGYEQQEVVCGKGDAFVLDMNAIHASGFNVSERIRFSAICRFHNMRADDFVPFRDRSFPNTLVQEKINAKS